MFFSYNLSLFLTAAALQLLLLHDRLLLVVEAVAGDDKENQIPLHNFIGELEESIGFYQAIELTNDGDDGNTNSSLLYSKESQYQQIEVHRSKHFGKMLVLDDVVQLTERDADSYNEMMAHIPMFQHPAPTKVLVVGGGDGYVLHEVLKHPTVTHVDHVDLDTDVITTCEQFFPQWADGWKDARTKLHIADGAKWAKETPGETYDVIIQDSSDPWTVNEDGVVIPLPSGVLYEKEHICGLYRILKPNGILNIQAESFNIPTSLEGIIIWRKLMEECGFERSRYGTIHTTSYPTGQIGFLLAEKNIASAVSSSSKSKNIWKRYQQMIGSSGTTTTNDSSDSRSTQRTTYYHPPLQRGCFDIPLWVHNKIYGQEDTSDLFCQLDVDHDNDHDDNEKENIPVVA
mmetsp:Transcript_16764/g.18465  ORF Transcript_16764/g.18465 Transcript_16764/m.18465 type:complete len:401 (-) Transcript_16764:259-1461(-)